LSDKRSGNRDISDLKQRLGLKKTGGAAGSGTGSTRAVNPGGGVVPPPGLNLPPPPGVAAPAAPPVPALPNAHEDPFGAMNAMAQVGRVQRAPEIVIVNDGKPVESVAKGSRGAMIGKLVAPAIVALAVGLIMGRVSKDANFYNDGLRGAKAIAGNVKEVKKNLSDLDSLLDELKTKTNYRPDAAIGKQLEAFGAKLDIKSELVFRAKENSLNADIAGQILSFYSGVAEIKGMLDVHARMAKTDETAMVAGKKAADDSKLKDTDNAPLAGQLKFAVVFTAPTESDTGAAFGARVVELGPVYCGDKTAASCGDSRPTGFGYRNDPGGVWTKGDIVTTGGESVPAKAIVPLIPNGTLDGFIRGGEASASEAYYAKRLRTLADRLKKLLTDANKLDGLLQSESSKGTRFSFFM
jgi:hypothetical protein